MEFSEFKDNPQDLIDKYVHYHSQYGDSIEKIVKVTKTGFRLEDMPDALFNLETGRRKTSNLWHKAICKLLSKDEELKLRGEFRKKRVIINTRDLISKELGNLTYDQLMRIREIIQPAKQVELKKLNQR